MDRYFEINAAPHNIRCKLYCENLRRAPALVIFVHGFGGHKDNGAAEKFARKLMAKWPGAGMITFNLPCHGDDVKKKLNLSDCLTYLDLVVDYARKNCPQAALFCYATSFGGYLTLSYLARFRNPFRAVALRCPAVNMHQVLTRAIIGREEQALLEKGKEAQVGFDRKIPVSPDFLEALRENDVRKLDYSALGETMLILQGTKDEIVNYDDVLEFSLEQNLELREIQDADHRFRHPGTLELAHKEILEHFRSHR